MDNTNISTALATVINEIVEMYDRGVLTREAMKYIISFCVDVAADFEVDIESVTSLINDRCSVCMKLKSKEALIRWDSTDYSVPEEWRRAAHNNAFGYIMVAGCVCESCVKALPVDGPED